MTEDTLREEFKRDFAVRVFPHEDGKEKEATVLEQVWQSTFLNGIADFWLSKRREEREALVKIAEAMKVDERTGLLRSDYNIESYEEKQGYNAAIKDFITHLRGTI